MTENEMLKVLSRKYEQRHEQEVRRRIENLLRRKGVPVEKADSLIAALQARGSAPRSVVGTTAERADAPPRRGYDRRDASVRAAADLDRKADELRRAADQLRQGAEARGLPRKTK